VSTIQPLGTAPPVPGFGSTTAGYTLFLLHPTIAIRDVPDGYVWLPIAGQGFTPGGAVQMWWGAGVVPADHTPHSDSVALTEEVGSGTASMGSTFCMASGRCGGRPGGQVSIDAAARSCPPEELYVQALDVTTGQWSNVVDVNPYADPDRNNDDDTVYTGIPPCMDLD
jgi:hypothetical protein